jgi:hypothetical protein
MPMSIPAFNFVAGLTFGLLLGWSVGRMYEIWYHHRQAMKPRRRQR